MPRTCSVRERARPQPVLTSQISDSELAALSAADHTWLYYHSVIKLLLYRDLHSDTDLHWFLPACFLTGKMNLSFSPVALRTPASLNLDKAEHLWQGSVFVCFQFNLIYFSENTNPNEQVLIYPEGLCLCMWSSCGNKVITYLLIG